LFGGAEELNKPHLYILAAVLAVVGLATALYKYRVLGFPLFPQTLSTVWNVEIRVSLDGQGKPAKVATFLPKTNGRYKIIDEQFVSGDFGIIVGHEAGNRQAVWSIRKAQGKRVLYYQATVAKQSVESKEAKKKIRKIKPAASEVVKLQGAKLQAAKALVKDLKKKSADNVTLAGELIKAFNKKEPSHNVKLLLGKKPNTKKKTELITNLLLLAEVPARIWNGVQLSETKTTYTKKRPLLTWIEVHDGKKWQSFSPLTSERLSDADLLRWWRGPSKLVDVKGAKLVRSTVSVSPKLEEAVAGAVASLDKSHPLLLKFSLFSLPVHTQSVYKVLLLIPVGAFALIILRNLVGIKTFGTFMPVLIALSFRETGLWRGVLLFLFIVALGLAIRFYLERLKLLLVPRLAAVLIVVVLLMAFISIVIRNFLGGHTGLSVALFPMVILTMTIERMSIVWEERGPGEALTSGLGSMLTAIIAFIVMKIDMVEHLVFVFPELLLVLLSVTLLFGRYTGYRMLDFYRFKELAKI
jgi:hypothetical protein